MNPHQAASYMPSHQKALKVAKKYIHRFLVTHNAFPETNEYQQYFDSALSQAREDSELQLLSPVKQNFEAIVSFMHLFHHYIYVMPACCLVKEPYVENPKLLEGDRTASSAEFL